MNDEVGVGVLNRAQHLAKQLQARRETEAMLVAVACQRRALDVFKSQIRLPVLGNAGIKQPRDVCMAEAGENLALAAESLVEQGPENGVYQLQSHPPREEAIDPLGKPYTAHAATAKQREDSVRTEASIDERCFGGYARDQWRQSPPACSLGRAASPVSRAANSRRSSEAALPPLEFAQPRAALLRIELE